MSAPTVAWADPANLYAIPQPGYNKTFTQADAAALVASVDGIYGDTSRGTTLLAGITGLTQLNADTSTQDLPNIYTGEPPSVIYVKSVTGFRANVYSRAPAVSSLCYVDAGFGFNAATAPSWAIPSYGTITVWAIVNGALTSNALSLTYDANGWTFSDKAVPLATDLSTAFTAFASSASGTGVIPNSGQGSGYPQGQNGLTFNAGMNGANPYVIYFPQNFSYGWFPDAGSQRLNPVIYSSFMYGSYMMQLSDDNTSSGSGTVRIHAAVANGSGYGGLEYLVPNELFIRVDDKGPGQLTATWGSRAIPPYVGPGPVVGPPFVPLWTNYRLTFEH